MDFLNPQTIIGIILSIAGTVFLLWGSNINSSKSTQQILDSQNTNTQIVLSSTEANTKKVLRSTEEISKRVLDPARGNDFAGALRIFNDGDMVIKKGIIRELKQKALANVNVRQQVIDFLGSLNDWVTEDDGNKDVFLDPQLEWSRWKMEKILFEKDGSIFNKEQQALSLEASLAIDEIVFRHIQISTNKKLHFFQKNILAPMFVDFDFVHGNIDLTKAKIFGLYMMGSKNISMTHFDSAAYYGITLFRSMQLPEIIYTGGDLGTDYLGDVHFLDIEFPRGANLTNSFFSADVHFVSVRFQEKAHFYVSTFKGVTRFDNCDFYGETGFNSVKFQKSVSFERSRFHGKAQFVTVSFGDGANFEGTSFVQAPDLKGTDQNQISNLFVQ